MPQNDLQSYTQSFHEDIATNAHALDMLREHAFVEKVTDILIDYGEIASCEPCHYQTRGIKIDGYGFDDEFVNLTLIISDWLDKTDITQISVPESEIDRQFKLVRNYFLSSLTGKLAQKIDISSPAHDLANLIFENASSLLSVKLVLVTDGVTQQRPATSETLNEIEVVGVVWDITRFHKFERTGKRDQISIDFEADYGGCISCTKRESRDGTYVTFLAFVSGTVLADLYATWKIRLLERNVRVFLSQRPLVNQGLRDTIRQEPDRFCAYNNGITVYAQGVVLKECSDGVCQIAHVDDFQIVNGGQTTASLYHTREKFKASLDDIAVPMKLIVVNETSATETEEIMPSLADVLVPKIGRFSNTQNKIQMADLLANEIPHPELHFISLNLSAPDPTGGSILTYWFYEKSRGSYEESRRMNAKTKAQELKFDKQYPRSQKFDKSKFGKAWNSYRKLPHKVCLGADKNFANFNVWLMEQKNENWSVFFQHTVSLLILWNETERSVRKIKYGGYVHAIVTYTLSWLHHLTDLKIDLDRIWQKQSVDNCLLTAIEIISREVNTHIRETDLNVAEWCKKEECWTRLQQRRTPDLPDLGIALIVPGAGKAYNMNSSTENDNIDFCVAKGAEAWFHLAKWLKEHNFMSGKQRSQCFNMGRAISSKGKPSAILATVCRKIWTDAADGYAWNYDIASNNSVN